MKKVIRNRNKGWITGLIAVLSGAAVISTGFAAWVISAPDSGNVIGNITVDTVDNNIHEISNVRLTTGKNAIHFGGLSADNRTSASLSYEWLRDSTPEQLVAECTFDVANVLPSGEADVEDIVSGIALTSTGGGTVDTSYTGYAGAVSKNYVKALETYTASDADGNSNFVCARTDSKTEKGTASFKITINFGWGTAFDSKNPEKYFDVENTQSNASEANTKLTQLHTLLDGVSYTITISTK